MSDETRDVPTRTGWGKLYNALVIPANRHPARLFVLLAAGLLLLGAAAAVDGPVSSWVHGKNLGPIVKQSSIAKIIKWPGVYYFTIAVAAVVAITGSERWRWSVAILCAGALSGLVYTVAKWCVGRTRPFPMHLPPEPPFAFHPFHKGFAGLWKADNQAFPSGHTCLAFATAAALAMFFPRGRAVFYLLASLVGIERVLEGAHYPSDTVAGAIFGILSAYLAAKWLRGLTTIVPIRAPRGFAVTPARNTGDAGAVMDNVPVPDAQAPTRDTRTPIERV